MIRLCMLVSSSLLLVAMSYAQLPGLLPSDSSRISTLRQVYGIRDADGRLYGKSGDAGQTPQIVVDYIDFGSEQYAVLSLNSRATSEQRDLSPSPGGAVSVVGIVQQMGDSTDVVQDIPAYTVAGDGRSVTFKAKDTITATFAVQLLIR